MNYYDVNDCYLSIQGEGSLAGTPMVILRMQGCSVGCPWCDTRETWEKDQDLQVTALHDLITRSKRQLHAGELDESRANLVKHFWAKASAEEIAHVVGTVAGSSEVEWVLITGGEPAEQELLELVHTIAGRGYKVAIETSGTARGHLLAPVSHVCVSPKMGFGKQIIPEVLANCDELKMVVASPVDIERLEELQKLLRPMLERLRDMPEIFLQPVSCSEKATKLCVEACLKHGWRLSVQTHKYIGVD